jgi:hypothetical protein
VAEKRHLTRPNLILPGNAAWQSRLAAKPLAAEAGESLQRRGAFAASVYRSLSFATSCELVPEILYFTLEIGNDGA